MKKNFFKTLIFLIAAYMVYYLCIREDYEKLADKITFKVAKNLAVEKGLRLIGTGGGMMDDIKMMEMSFQYFHEVTVEEGRQLVVTSVEEYLSAINNDQKIRKYLHEYPFTPKNIEISIWIRNPDGSNVDFDKISYISFLEGILTYKLDKAEKGKSRVVHEESYEDALRAVSRKESVLTSR